MWIGLLCEEFHCRPSDAYREWLRAPAGLLEDIIEARMYARAKHIYDDAHAHGRRAPSSPLFDMVQEIEFDLAREELDATKAESHG